MAVMEMKKYLDLNGLNYYNQKLKAYLDEKIGMGLKVSVSDQLPTEPQERTIYLIPGEGGVSDNLRDEFLWLDGVWERIGSTKITIPPITVEGPEYGGGISNIQVNENGSVTFERSPFLSSTKVKVTGDGDFVTNVWVNYTHENDGGELVLYKGGTLPVIKTIEDILNEDIDALFA